MGAEFTYGDLIDDQSCVTFGLGSREWSEGLVGIDRAARAQGDPPRRSKGIADNYQTTQGTPATVEVPVQSSLTSKPNPIVGRNDYENKMKHIIFGLQ